MSTPITDAQQFDWAICCRGEAPPRPAVVVDAETARRLERDRKDAIDMLKRTLSWLSSYPGGGALNCWSDVHALLSRLEKREK